MPLSLAMLMASILSFFLGCIPPEKDSTDTATDSNVVVIDTDPPPGTDADEDGYTAEDGDCNDNNAGIHPHALEFCDGYDNDCDQIAENDAVDAITFYGDSDGDEYGNPTDIHVGCVQLAGWATNNSDCNDRDVAINPDATEMCDGIDNNCDGVVDEDSASDAVTWYQDDDGDGHGNSGSWVSACTNPPGYADNADDCDDNNAITHPGIVEVCDGFDNDCDGDVDNLNVAQASQGSLWYPDVDGDGHGGMPVIRACSQPERYFATQTDCNDNDSAVNPDAIEICDLIDNDCDYWADDADSSTVGQTTYWGDYDVDGYGDPQIPLVSCYVPGPPFVSNDDDCNDMDYQIKPYGREIWYNGIDENCDGLSDYDQDGDGYDAYTYGGTDCYDTDPAIQTSISCGG